MASSRPTKSKPVEPPKMPKLPRDPRPKERYRHHRSGEVVTVIGVSYDQASEVQVVWSHLEPVYGKRTKGSTPYAQWKRDFGPATPSVVRRYPR